MREAVTHHTVALIARAATLHADLTAVWATSRVLIGRGRQLTFGYPLPWPLRGGSDSVEPDAGAVAAMVHDAPMCMPCLARKARMEPEQVIATLRSVARSVRLTVGTRRCTFCLERKTTFCVTANSRPAVTRGRAPGRAREGE